MEFVEREEDLSRVKTAESSHEIFTASFEGILQRV